MYMCQQWSAVTVLLRYSTIPLFPDRSFPRHKMFIQGTSEGKEGRAALFRVLAVYALYNPEVSYCQGNPSRAPIDFFLFVCPYKSGDA